MVRIPSFIVVIASFVTLLQMVMQAYVLDLVCYARSFHSVDRSKLYRTGTCRKLSQPRITQWLLCLMVSVWDLVSPIALTLLGAVREFLGTGKISI